MNVELFEKGSLSQVKFLFLINTQRKSLAIYFWYKEINVMKLHKSILTLSLVLMLVMSAMVSPAFAADTEVSSTDSDETVLLDDFGEESGIMPLNSSDTSYVVVNVPASTGSWKAGEKRAKDNNTPIYFWGRVFPGETYVRVRAAGYVTNSSLSTPQYCTTLKNGTQVTYVTCRIGQEYVIYNQIYEGRYSYAGLAFTRNTTASVNRNLEYTWSPDSVNENSYTAAT